MASREKCGDSVVIPCGCDYDVFAEVASLGEHAGVTVGVVPPADMDSVLAAGASYVEQCQEHVGLAKSAGLYPATKDKLFCELEAIVVGAVGTGAPWFLIWWAEKTEVEFMIDTRCQVTILATSVFERICVTDPQFQSRLRPCRRRLVLADSSPLMICGEFCICIPWFTV